MTRWLLLAILLGLAGCKASLAGPTAIVPTLPPPSPTADGWAHVTSEGIQLSILTPPGWQAISNEYGILLAEHADLVQNDPPQGMLIYVFVPKMDHIPLARSGSNRAWTVLDHVARLPSYTGNARVGAAVPFEWDHHDAAYYLLSDSDGSRTMVLGVALPGGDKLVVCNASTTAGDASRIREILPNVLASLTVDGQRMDVDALKHLPDPLLFPAYEVTPAAAPPPV